MSSQQSAQYSSRDEDELEQKLSDLLAEKHEAEDRAMQLEKQIQEVETKERKDS